MTKPHVLRIHIFEWYSDVHRSVVRHFNVLFLHLFTDTDDFAVA